MECLARLSRVHQHRTDGIATRRDEGKRRFFFLRTRNSLPRAGRGGAATTGVLCSTRPRTPPTRAKSRNLRNPPYRALFQTAPTSSYTLFVVLLTAARKAPPSALATSFADVAMTPPRPVCVGLFALGCYVLAVSRRQTTANVRATRRRA